MLIHIRHLEQGELCPDRLVFQFAECGFRQKVEYMNRKIQSSSRVFAQRKPEETFLPNLMRISKGEQIFAQLSPKAGDNFCFWIPQTSKTDINLVISPLTSLMRDQNTPFQVHGALPNIRGLNYTDIRMGKIHLIYIDPKCLIYEHFMDEIQTVIEDAPVNCLIVDNVHCVSEWSNEFWPSYRRIPQIIDSLKKDHPKLTCLALTAEPGSMIKKDIKTFLYLDSYSTGMNKNVYSPNLSYQVIGVKNSQEKAEKYHKIMSSDIPDIIKKKYNFLPYQDLYEPVLNGTVDPIKSELFSITTRNVNTVSDAPDVLFFGTLAGSLESWLYKIVGLAQNHIIHCVRLADLPNDLCEKDMAQRMSRIPSCKNMQCPFDRKNLCDYGKQHHIILQNAAQPVQDTIEILQILDYLLSSFEAGDTPVQIDLTSLDPKSVESALYRLSIIGVVEEFFMDYSCGHSVFKIYGFINGVETTAALKGLLSYMRHNDLSLTQKYKHMTIKQLRSPFGEIARHCEKYGPDINEKIKAKADDFLNYSKYSKIFYEVAEYMPLILKMVYDEIQVMAYRRLWNLKEFILSNHCCYARLLQTVHAVDDDWKCKACDKCVPNLKFGKRIAPFFIPPLEEKFSTWLEKNSENFNSESADQFIEKWGDYFYNIEMRSRRILENSPRNLNALYLAREISRNHVKDRNEVELMQVACRDLKRLQLIRLYETARVRKEIRQIHFDLLDDEYGIFNSPEGEKWLYAQARALNFVKGEPYRMVAARQILNTLASTDFLQINNKLDNILKELERGSAIQS